MSNTVAPPLSLVPMASRSQMAEKVADEGVPLGSKTTGCSLSLAGTGRNFETTRAPIVEAVGKHAEVRDICVVGLPGSVGV
eukprot:5197858-Pleurochrysis_carterae.AAC.1